METEPREIKRRGGFRDEGEVGGAGKRPRASSPQVPISSDNATANGGIGEGSTGAVSSTVAATDADASHPSSKNGSRETERSVVNGDAAVSTPDSSGDSKPAASDSAPSSSFALAPTGAPTSSASAATPSSPGQATSEPPRWRSHRIAEDYISMASNLILPNITLGPFGYDASCGLFPTERITTLGLLTSPLRRPTVLEKWNPYEISVFEASMALYGKDFHEITRILGTKDCKEVVEFYYIWKKTEHYKVWKKAYTPHLDADSDEE